MIIFKVKIVMFNECLFFFQSVFISFSALVALRYGPSGLVSFMSVSCILANLFVLKQTTIFGFNATCADAFTVGATISLNLLQEYFGKIVARKAIVVNFFLLVFYLIVTYLHLLYVPAGHDVTHDHFAFLLTPMPRIVIASFAVYLFVQHLDYCLYGFLKSRYQDRFLVLRNYVSIAICQLIDTVLFSFLGLWGLVDNIGQVIIVSYSVKMLSIFIATPCIRFSRFIFASYR